MNLIIKDYKNPLYKNSCITSTFLNKQISKSFGRGMSIKISKQMHFLNNILSINFLIAVSCFVIIVHKTMASKINLDLGNGVFMPILGFGTWQATDKELESALDAALEAGYRHIDTAYVYENEATIGRVLKRWIDSGKLNRSELFITTKLPDVGNRPSSVEKYIKKSLANLQLDYLDLYLIHTPFTFQERGEDIHPFDENGYILLDLSTDIIGTWKEMEKQVDAGLTRAIGISNFNKTQIERILAKCRIKPSNLQIELHTYFQQRELVNFCDSQGIKVTAYSPLGSRGIGALFKALGIDREVPDILANPTILDIAKKHNVTAAQVVLRHTIQRGVAAIPKSTHPDRIKANIDIFDFKLDDDDVKAIDALDKTPNGRVCDFKFFKGIEKHPEFPF